MSTTQNPQLDFSNFISPVSYTYGKGKLTENLQKLNWYDDRLLFLTKTMQCQKYIVPAPSFLPNISYLFYKTTSLWWVIAKFNSILFPLKEIKTGTVLYIPSLSELSKYLNQASGSTTGASNETVKI